jgi:DNA-binding response OmpR family regulator
MTSQGIQSSSEPALFPAISVDSSTQVCISALKEIRRLAQFLPVIVLVPESGKHHTLHGRIAVEYASEATGVQTFGALDKAIKQFKDPEIESAFGDVIVNFREMTACRAGVPVMLTTMEFKAVKYLIRNARRVISRDELLNEVWGCENYPCARTVDNLILKLRHKLEREPSRPRHFRTVHGSGYKFMP